MKKLVLMLVTLFAFHSVMLADNEVPVTVSQLPATAQKFIKTHFSISDISRITMEREWVRKSYEVTFVNGDKLDFDNKGNWTELNCKYSKVPDAAVPKAIRTFVTTNYPGRMIKKMERDTTYFEIELDNGLEIKFNKQFKVVKVDD